MHVGGDGDEGGDEDVDAFFTAGAGRGRPPRAQARGDRPVRGDDRLAGGTLSLKQCQLARLPRCFACQGHGHISRDCANPPNVKISVETNISLLSESQRARGPGRSAPRPASSSQAASSSSSRSDRSRARDARPVRGAPPERQAQRGQRDRGRGRAYYAEGENDEEEGEDEYSDDGSGIDDSYFTSVGSPPTSAPPALLARDIAERLAFIDDTGAFGGSGFDEAYACDVGEPAAPQPVAREPLEADAPRPAPREPLGRRFRRRRDVNTPSPAVVLVGGAAYDSLELCDDCFVTWPEEKSPLERAWVIDCGSTKHIVPDISDLDYVTNGAPGTMVRVANKEFVPVTAIGVATVYVDAIRVTKVNGVDCAKAVCVPMRLTNVFVVPGISARLFSCRWGFDSNNISTRLEADLCLTLPTGEKVPFVPHGNGLHYNILAQPAPKADILLIKPDALNGCEARIAGTGDSLISVSGACIRRSVTSASRATARATTPSPASPVSPLAVATATRPSPTTGRRDRRRKIAGTSASASTPTSADPSRVATTASPTPSTSSTATRASTPSTCVGVSIPTCSTRPRPSCATTLTL